MPDQLLVSALSSPLLLLSLKSHFKQLIDVSGQDTGYSSPCSHHLITRILNGAFRPFSSKNLGYLMRFRAHRDNSPDLVLDLGKTDVLR